MPRRRRGPLTPPLSRKRERGDFSVAMELSEHRAGLQTQGQRKLRRRQFLGVLALGLEHLDLSALPGDTQALGTDLRELADLALHSAERPEQMLSGIEDLDLLAVV